MNNGHVIFVTEPETNLPTKKGSLQTLTSTGFAIERLSDKRYELIGWDGWEGLNYYLSLSDLRDLFDALRLELTVRGLLQNDGVPDF